MCGSSRGTRGACSSCKVVNDYCQIFALLIFDSYYYQTFTKTIRKRNNFTFQMINYNIKIELLGKMPGIVHDVRNIQNVTRAVKHIWPPQTLSLIAYVYCLGIETRRKPLYCITSVEQYQTATQILVALERCCSSEVLFNGKCHCAEE